MDVKIRFLEAFCCGWTGYEAWRPWHEPEVSPKEESELRASSSPPPDPQYWGIVVYTP